MQSNAFTITAELVPHRQTTADEALSHARQLADSVDGIQIAESPNAWAQVSPVALAGLLIRSGIDAIPRLTCRDRNRIALQSDLLGLRATGVTSVVLTRGSPLPDDQEPMARAVFDVSCRELIAMAHTLNEEGSSSVQNELLIGTDATAFLPPPNWSAETLMARASAGARFLQTQPCSDLDLLRKYMRQLVEARITWNYSVIVSLAPEREGVETCAGLMREIAGIPGVSGINLHSLGNPEMVTTVIRASGLR